MDNFGIRGDEIRHGQHIYLDTTSQAIMDSFSDAPLPEALHLHLSDGRVAFRVSTAKAIAGEIKNSDGMVFALCLQETKQCIGLSRLAEIDWKSRRAELSVHLLDEAYLTAEMVTDSICTTLQYAYWEANLNRIGLQCVDNNVLIREAVTAIGFTEEGKLRQQAYRNGQYLDIVKYSILAREFSEQ